MKELTIGRLGQIVRQVIDDHSLVGRSLLYVTDAIRGQSLLNKLVEEGFEFSVIEANRADETLKALKTLINFDEPARFVLIKLPMDPK